MSLILSAEYQMRSVSDFFHLRLGSNRSVGVGLDAADVNNGSGAGEQMLELDSEVGEDVRNTAGTNPVGRHLGTGSLHSRYNNVVPHGRILGNHMSFRIVTLDGLLPRRIER